MHSKSPVVNLAEPSGNTFSEQVNSRVQQSILLLIFKKAVPIHLLITHYDYSQNVNDRIIL